MILYILLLIVLTLLLFKVLKYNRNEGFKSDLTNTIENNKKCLIVYYGGSFREGNIGSTLHDTQYGYESQKNASITHAKLKQILNKKGYETDILINTRHTEYKKDLLNWYNPFNIIINKIPIQIHGKDYMITSCIENINNLKKEEYKFILFIRIDLFLKPDFFNVLNTESNKIMFLANNYDAKRCSNYNNGQPEVVDLFLYIPNKYFYILDNKFKLNHDALSYLKKKYKLIDDDFNFMTNKIFDSNSFIDLNPYYVMGSRSENKEMHTKQLFENKKINKKYCKYDTYYQKYLINPTDFYLNKYKDFYLT